MASRSILWEGWLEKQGKMRLEGYSRRYFVLTDQAFEYWAPPKGAAPRSSITEALLRQHGFTRQGSIAMTVVMSVDDQPAFGFVVRTDNRSYVLRAAALEEKQECMRMLNRVLAQRLAVVRNDSVGGGVPTSDVSDHDYEGWIFKRGQRRHNWKRRYAVLDGNVLKYYVNQTHARDKTAAKGRIVIQAVTAVDGPKANTFGFNCEAIRRADEFYAYVQTEAERIAWIDAIRKNPGQSKRRESSCSMSQYESDEDESERGSSSELPFTPMANPFLKEPKELPSVDERKVSTEPASRSTPDSVDTSIAAESAPIPPSTNSATADRDEPPTAQQPAPMFGRNAGDPVDMCGWLWKKGEIRQAWKRRYFTLQGKILKYYEDEMTAAEEKGAKGEYEVVSAEYVQDPVLFKMDIRTLEGRIMQTYTERIELRTRWMDAIQAATNKQKSRPASLRNEDGKSSSSSFTSRVGGQVARTFKNRKPPSPVNPKARKPAGGRFMQRRIPIADIAEHAQKGGDFFGSDDDEDSDCDSDDSTGTEGIIRASLSNEQHHLAFACALLDSPDARKVASGLTALTELSVEDEMCFAMEEEGILPIIIDCMRANSENSHVQEQALKLCVNLCYHDPLAALFVMHGGINLVLNALTTHSKSAGVQQHGLHVLKNLAASDSHRRVVLKEMGLTVVIASVKAHPKVAAVQEEGIGALANFATDGESTRLQMVEKGVLRLLEAAQARHSPDSNVHEACSRFIANFGM